MRSTSLRTRSLEPIGNLSQERAYRMPYLSSSCVPRVTLTRVSRYANNRTCASDASNDQANDLSHIDDSLSRRQLGLSLVAAPLSAFPAAPTWAKDPEAAVSKARYRESKMVMRALALRGSVPQQWLIDFRAALEGWGIASVSFKPELKDIWKELEGTGGKKNQRTNMDVVTVGDAWLQQAISRGLIQPIGEQELVQQYRYWNALNPRWKRLVRRSSSGQLSRHGAVWGVPYRWGCTLILYRRERMRRWGKQIEDWDDLLLPGLRNRIAFMDYPREFLGIALKTLGVSYNAGLHDLHACGITRDQLSSRVHHLIQQAKVMSNENHIRAYAAGDVDVIVGSSQDLLPLAQKSSSSRLIVPASGTALWADIWCIPTNASGGAVNGEPSPLLPAWFELGLQPVRSRSNQGMQFGVSPLLLPGTVAPKQCSPLRDTGIHSDGSNVLQDRDIPSSTILERSEFIEPLDSHSIEFYRSILKSTSR